MVEKFAEVPEENTDKQKNTYQDYNTIHGKPERSAAELACGGCEACQETTYQACRWCPTGQPSIVDKKCGTHTRTRKRSVILLQGPFSPLY